MFSNIQAYVCKRGERDRGRELILKMLTNLIESDGKHMGRFGGKRRRGELMELYYNLKTKK